MRTTLDLDETALAAARSRARARGISLGKAVSEMVLATLHRTGQRGLVDVAYSPFPVFFGDQPVTDELVADHRDD